MGFLACRVYSENKKIDCRLEQMEIGGLSKGEVVIKVAWSGVNYKDALAATGKGKIMRQFPLNAGIDLAGVVERSEDDRFAPGDEVLANGCGLGEEHDGGLAQYARIPADWVVPLPSGMTQKEAMIHGTAGFTAALAIHRMERMGQTPDKGPIAVTGASGGVGSIAVAILSKLGYETVAISGRPNYERYLAELGATQVSTPDDLGLKDRPLEKARYGGVVDNVGGELLAKLIAHTNLWGNVAAIGMAQDFRLSTTVFPFILRGVNLLGASSMNCPMPLRKTIWNDLAGPMKPADLGKILTQEVPLADVGSIFPSLLDRKLHGRVVVNCG